MAIRKVTRIYDGVSKEVLSLDDILSQVGANEGETIDFLGMAEVIGIPLTINGEKNPITLPDSFVGEDLSLSAPSATASPTSLDFNAVGGSRNLSVSTTGVYKISSKPAWVSIDRSFARNSNSFGVIASYNNNLNDSDRSGNIVFVGSGNTTILTVPVSQTGNSLTATITPTGIQSLTSSDGTTSIVVRLSSELSITDVVLSNTVDFEISTPTTSTSSGVVTYTYTLTRYLADTNKTTTVTIGYQGEGINERFDAITFNQVGFQPTVNANPSNLNFPSNGKTLYYDVVDADTNTTWRATISGDGYSHSTSETSGFKTTAITGNANGDRIWVKIGSHNNTDPREGTATITTTFGSNDVSDTVGLSQAAASTFADSDITISGFSVDSDGSITAPDVTITGDISYTIEYSSAATFPSTALVSESDGFDLVNTDTDRYVRVSVTVPAGYTNQNTTFRKVETATQNGLSSFLEKQITMEATRLFRVNSYGTITSPSVSVPTGITYTLRYTTGDANTVTAYSSRFPKVSADVTRYANALVVVPAGYYNEGQTVIKTVTDTQEDFDPTLSIATSALDYVIAGETHSFVVTSNYSWVSSISNLGTSVFQQSLDNVNFTTDDIIGGSTTLSSSRNTTIYIKTAKNGGEDRIGAVNVTTNFGHLDSTDGVVLTQDGEPTFDITDWTGTVSINRQTGAVSATTGNSLSTPTFTPSSFGLVTATTNRTVSVTVKAPDTYNNHNSLVTGNVTVSQLKFLPSVSTNVSARTFAYTGETFSYTITSNTTWSATISGTGFSHSTSQTTGFKTTAITGTSAGDTIWVKAAGHLGAERYGTATVTTTFGGSDVSTDVDLTQLEAPTFTSSNISVSGFAVNYLGTITAPSSTPTATAIVYSTTQNGTSVSSFSSVSSNTTRWCRVSVTVPAGYQNTGATVTRTNISTTQPFKATIDVEPESHTFSNVGSYKDYTVSSNTTWTVANYPSWITIDDTTGGGSDTKFRATATAQSNPAVLRSSTLRAYTNTSANGTYSDYVSFSQPARANWSLSTIGNLGDTQWSVTNLTSTTASLVKFTFNIPYTFNFMDSNFDRTNFGFFVNNGAGYSTTSHTFTTGNKTFTLTANNNILPIANTISFDVGSVVSIAKRTYRLGIEGQVDEYMIGTVSGWNSSTKQLTVNISSTNNIQTNNNTVSYTSWEINQISGTGTSTTNFPRLYTRNDNVSGAARTTTIKLDDTNDTYDQGTLSQTITQPLQAWSGNIYIAGQYRTDIGSIDYRFINTSASNTVLYMSVSVRTNYAQPLEITSDSLSGIWISTSSGGSARSPILSTSTTGTTTQFYVRWGSTSGGIMNVDISSPGNDTTSLYFNIQPVGSTGVITCLIEGTLVTLSDGTTTTIESLMIGQSVKSTVIDTLPQSDDADIVLPWSTQNLVTSDDSANVTGNTKSVVESIYNFNNGLIKSTESHGHFIKRGNDYMFKNAFNVEVGDYFVTENLEEILIEDIVIEFGEFNVYNLDVEENDLYIANGIITHNAIKAPNEK